MHVHNITTPIRRKTCGVHRTDPITFLPHSLNIRFTFKIWFFNEKIVLNMHVHMDLKYYDSLENIINGILRTSFQIFVLTSRKVISWACENN